MLIELIRDFPSFEQIVRSFPSLNDIARLIDLEASFHRYFLVILLFVFSLIYLLQKAKRNFPPGPIALPVVGNIDLFKSKAHIRLSNLKDKYGDVYSLRVGSYDFIVVSSLEGMMEGLNRSDSVLDGRPDFSVFDHLFKGNKQRGVFTADSDLKNEIKRKFMVESLDTHCTSPSTIEDEIKRETLNLMCFFLQESGPFDPLECLKFAHLHIMMLLIFDERFDSDDFIRDRIFEALDERYASLKIKFHHYFPSLQSFYKENTKKLLMGSDILIRYEKMLLNQHKDTYNPMKIRDLVDQMLLFIETNEDSELLESDDMDDLLLELSGAGFYTVPALLSWLLAYMAAFPDVQQKLQNEIDSIVGRERFPSLEDEPYLPYTIAVILEVQRVVTIMPLLLPHRAVKSCVFQGYNIPKDSLYLFNVWSLHHDQRHWKNPMKFNPDRFLDESGALFIPDYFVPFGLGHRRCPGESLVEIEVYVMFTCIMHQLRVCASPQARELNLEADFSYILTPKDLKIEVKERDN
ncbi:hypothetical protein FSP39_024621 [Pinctada imbricata]|uniref:unspecific monooxygenase n=1 Tax=Pinctada imbricata TaxID=66713 RepID=A0AA88XIL8_PINIB|nr:hypothetical protein FSP39_024621 [Pinctada imbricata]